VAVVASFRDVFSAQEDMAVDMNQAQAYANDQGPKARGRAYAAKERAKAVATERLAKTRGQTRAFLARLGVFAKARDAVGFIGYVDAVVEALRGQRLFLVGRDVPRVRYIQRDAR
jgi:regulator of protease activity HflC (stomatin/prohibitin superfamily)